MLPLDPIYDERGLLGFTLHPDSANNGRAFVHYSAPLRDSAPEGFDHTSVVSELQLGDGGSAATERNILQVDQPQSNHNGGAIAFGPDGYLYLTFGDGGNADDVGLGHVDDWYEVNEGGNGQDRSANLLGSILRIDVNGAEPYAIPPDNPFAGAELPEIWAYGNPFQLAFDRGGSGQLFVGDVGQNLWEEGAHRHRGRELRLERRSGADLGEFVLGLAEDAAGELYVLTTEVGAPSGTSGKVYRIEP